MGFINIKHSNNQTVTVREFTKITNNEEAYLIGYLLGDGSYLGTTYGNKNRTPRLSIGSTEEYIINHFRDYYMPNKNVQSRIPTNHVRPEIVSKIPSYKLDFSVYFSEAFEYHGILSLKKTRTFNNIPQEFMKSLLIGLIDSDGCITWGRRKDRDRLWIKINVTHQSIEMFEKLQKYLKDELNIPSYIHDKGDENCKVLSFCQLEDARKFINWLYVENESLPQIHNLTKYQNAINFVLEYERENNIVLEKVKGVRITKTSYVAFIVENKQFRTIKNTKDYDEAVGLRLCAEALYSGNLSRHYDSMSNTLRIKYISLNDNLQTFIESDLQGNILTHHKLPQ